MLGIEAAYDTLIRALASGTERTRSSILGVLWALPGEDAEQVLSYFVLSAPCRGSMWEVHARAIERLGVIGNQNAVNALAAVLQRRRFWSRFKMAVLHRLTIDALGRIGTPAAVAVLETVADSGSRLVRNAARVRLGAAMGSGTREGPTG
jgi:HEAT repeat protein